MEKKIYKCGICGKEYSSILERATCEIECDKKRKEDEAKRKELELNQKKQERYEEVEKAYQHYHDLLEAYVEDYGMFRAPSSHEYPNVGLAELFNNIFM